MHISARASAAACGLFLAGLLSGCGESTSPQVSSTESTLSMVAPDVDHAFYFLSASGDARTLRTRARHTGGGHRSIIISLDGRPLAEIRESWQMIGGKWQRVSQSARSPGLAAGPPPPSTVQTRNDALVTPPFTMLSHGQDCGGSDNLVAYDGFGCTKEALVFIGAGLVAEAAIAAAVANPLLIGGAYAAITAVAVAYAEYIACLQQPK